LPLLSPLSQAEQEAYRKASLERELEALRIAHKHFHVNQKSISHADRALAKFERLEYLWSLLREHCHNVGRERILSKRRELEMERIRSLQEEQEVTQVTESRRRSVRASVTATGTSTGIGAGTGTFDSRRKSVRASVTGTGTGTGRTRTISRDL
jgi:hypothetical protein